MIWMHGRGVSGRQLLAKRHRKLSWCKLRLRRFQSSSCRSKPQFRTRSGRSPQYGSHKLALLYFTSRFLLAVTLPLLSGRFQLAVAFCVDLRRTAVRNMMDAGIPQSHAMYISGHKTDSIFRRYDIISDDQLTAASVKMQNLFDEKLGPKMEGKDKKVAKSDAKSRPNRHAD